jgi:hypothetical protein
MLLPLGAWKRRQSRSSGYEAVEALLLPGLMRSASEPLYELLSMGRERDLVAGPKVSPRR